jgi:hypothetical protein
MPDAGRLLWRGTDGGGGIVMFQHIDTGPERYVVGDGPALTLHEIAARVGITPDSVRDRLRSGRSGPARMAPPYQQLKATVDGRLMSVPQIAAQAGVSRNTIRSRIRRGMRGRGLLARAQP